MALRPRSGLRAGGLDCGRRGEGTLRAGTQALRRDCFDSPAGQNKFAECWSRGVGSRV